MTDRMDTEALRALSDTPKTAIYRDKDGDVCIDDGREWNLVFCPATDEGGSYLCPDVVDEIIARYAAAPALAAEVLELRAERDAIAAAAFGYAIEAVRGENKRCLDLASIRIPAMARELEAALRKATPADAKAALDRMIEAAVKTATAQGDRA